jgi:hypothetical protein
MLQGTGHNNPAYGFFGTFEYTNAPGGIVNGITSGFEDEHDIDFNIPYAVSGKDSDWRWAEQWLPHAAWYLLAVATDHKSRRMKKHLFLISVLLALQFNWPLCAKRTPHAGYRL